MMFCIVIVLVAALILSLGCNVKQEYELEVLRAENDELMDALAALQVRTETRSTARQSVHFTDSPTGMRCPWPATVPVSGSSH
jgi:hypothetical protein